MTDQVWDYLGKGFIHPSELPDLWRNRPMNDWISVEERLPETGDYGESRPVLVWNGWHMKVARRTRYTDRVKTGWRDDFEDEILWEVSHWMPLPSTPEEK